MMFEILTGIKLLGVSSFCSVVTVYLSLFKFQLTPRSHTEAHPTLWFASQCPPPPMSKPRTGRLYHLTSLRLRQFPEYPKLLEERIEPFRAQLTAFQMLSPGQPGELTRGRKGVVTVPLFLLFRALPREFLHWDDVMWFTVVLFPSFLVAITFFIFIEFCYGLHYTIESCLLKLPPSQPMSMAPGREGAQSQKGSSRGSTVTHH